MNALIRSSFRVAATLVAVAAAAAAGQFLWKHYRESPWTRDGRVRADVVQVAPDVSGLVDKVVVHDNQEVHRGDLLFALDAERSRIALSQARAAVVGLKSQIAQSQREDKRNGDLKELVPAEVREQSTEKLEQLHASLLQAQAAVDAARVNLVRTEVRAPVDGWVTNFDLRPGAYAVTGHPVLAIVDSQSIHVMGYFEETKIARIHVGDRVQVRLMGERAALAGHVDSIAAGIEDRDRQQSSNLLANVNPTFNWVRLAQRIPVRVQLDRPPEDSRLIMGRTATVSVMEGSRAVAVASRGEGS